MKILVQTLLTILVLEVVAFAITVILEIIGIFDCDLIIDITAGAIIFLLLVLCIPTTLYIIWRK